MGSEPSNNRGKGGWQDAARQFCFASLPVIDYLMTSAIFHFFPLLALDPRTQAGNAETGLSIKFANFDAR